MRPRAQPLDDRERAHAGTSGDVVDATSPLLFACPRAVAYLAWEQAAYVALGRVRTTWLPSSSPLRVATFSWLLYAMTELTPPWIAGLRASLADEWRLLGLEAEHGQG